VSAIKKLSAKDQQFRIFHKRYLFFRFALRALRIAGEILGEIGTESLTGTGTPKKEISA
jgi:hypothetical protein